MGTRSETGLGNQTTWGLRKCLSATMARQVARLVRRASFPGAATSIQLRRNLPSPVCALRARVSDGALDATPCSEYEIL